MKTAIYTCTFSDYDLLLSPVARTPGCDFVAFVDKPQVFARRWRFAPLPETPNAAGQNEINRYCKLFPSKILPDYDLSIYVDGNILIGADLTPLIQEFIASDADIALFPGQHDRTVAEEIELTLRNDKILPERRDAARRQLDHLRAAGEADLPITMNGVLFRRHNRPRLNTLMQDWWQNINAYAMRDQFGLPGLLRRSDVTIHRWNWQYFYVRNPYFHVYPHRKGAPRLIPDIVHAMRARARYCKPDRYILRAAARIRRVV